MNKYCLSLMNRTWCEALILLAVVCCCGCQAELAKWEFASALQEEKSGDHDSALQRMKSAVEIDSSSSWLKLQLAIRLAKHGDQDAIDLCEQASEAGYSREAVLKTKAVCQNYLGEFGSALVTYKELLSDHIERDKDELNELAYHRALAKRELPLAVDDIQKAIRKLEEDRWPFVYYLRLSQRVAMANAMVCRHLDRRELAIRSLSQQVEVLELKRKVLELEHDRLQRKLAFSADFQAQTKIPLEDALAHSIDLIKNQQEINRLGLAHILSVRALLYEDLAEKLACYQDRCQVQDLNYNADEIVAKLPQDIFFYLEELRRGAALLDTRGFVFTQLHWHQAELDRIVIKQERSALLINNYVEALRDLDVAVTAATTLRVALESGLFNSMRIPVEEAILNNQHIKRTEAVILYHRAQAHRKQGNTKLAEEDEAAVRKLGEEPSDKLF